LGPAKIVIEVRRPVAFSDGRGHDGAVFDPVQFEMPPMKGHVSRKGSKAYMWPACEQAKSV
jgi:hypothetical protein